MGAPGRRRRRRVDGRRLAVDRGPGRGPVGRRARGGMGLHPGRAEGMDRRPRGRDDDHAELHRRVVIGYLITGPLEAPGFSFSRTGDRRERRLPVVPGTTSTSASSSRSGSCPVVWWLLWRSTLGFEIRTVGANPDAARYAGMHPAFLTILTMSLCGLLAGLAGAGQILGISRLHDRLVRHVDRIRLDLGRPARAREPVRASCWPRSCSAPCAPGRA